MPDVPSETIRTRLANVFDPEIHISIVDLGLIYEVNPTPDGGVHIVMTLTTLGCPLFHVIEADIKKQLHDLGYGDDQIELEVVFDPPWSMEMMSENAKAQLGI